MNPFTALGFLAISAWQLLNVKTIIQKKSIVHVISIMLPFGVFLLGFMRLLDIAARTNFSPDYLLYTSDIGNARISPVTAFNFIFCGLAMMFFNRRSYRKSNLVLLFMTPVFTASVISFFGYLIANSNMLTLKPFVPMALHTSLCFIALVANFIFLYPKNIFTQIIMSKDSGGYTSRKLLPYIFIVPLLLGFLRYHGERLGLYDAGFGVAIIVVGTILVFIVVVLRQALELSKIDTYRREAEEKVQERSEELINANTQLDLKNKELEQFTYAASHDMQEPLRKIQIYSSVLLNNNTDRLDEKSINNLSKISLSVRRMKTIIDDLLKYSHQTREDQKFILTDLNTIFENIELDLELVILQKNAVITRDNLPSINAVPTQIHQLFYNLITNALKFIKTGVTPQIQIKKEEVTGEELKHLTINENKNYVHISITDNGIGFEQQYEEKIFSLFNRLHVWAEYEGTGIGLALCKKIAENHGGFIWANSHPGEGSTFHVLMPI